MNIQPCLIHHNLTMLSHFTRSVSRSAITSRALSTVVPGVGKGKTSTGLVSPLDCSNHMRSPSVLRPAVNIRVSTVYAVMLRICTPVRSSHHLHLCSPFSTWNLYPLSTLSHHHLVYLSLLGRTWSWSRCTSKNNRKIHSTYWQSIIYARNRTISHQYRKNC